MDWLKQFARKLGGESTTRITLEGVVVRPSEGGPPEIWLTNVQMPVGMVEEMARTLRVWGEGGE